MNDLDYNLPGILKPQSLNFKYLHGFHCKLGPHLLQHGGIKVYDITLIFILPALTIFSVFALEFLIVVGNDS